MSAVSRQRFGQNYRLHQWKDFQKFFQGSEILRLTHATVFRIPNHHGHLRLGFTVKGKPLAVVRNRMKRQVREVFRLHQQDLGPYDYNFVCHATNSGEMQQRAALWCDFLREAFQQSPVHFEKVEKNRKKRAKE